MEDRGPRILASAPSSGEGGRMTVRHVLLVLVGLLVGCVIGVVAGGGSTTTTPAPGDPGPARVNGEGAPQGFAHTRDGAVAAAVAYVDAVGAPEITSEDRFAALVNAIATPQLAERMRSQAAAAQRSPGIRRAPGGDPQRRRIRPDDVARLPPQLLRAR